MNPHQLEPVRSRPPVLRRITAAVVLAVIGYFLLHIVLSFVISIVLVVAVVIGVGWALKTLIW
jgi:hypothetical protein